jgi:membrane protein
MVGWAKTTARDIYEAYQNWQEDDGSHMAASVSFYMAVSLFPLLLVLISAMGFALRHSGWGQNAHDRLLEIIADQTAPSLTRQLEMVLSNVEQSASIGGPAGIVMLIVASMAVFVHFDDAMDRIWSVSRRNRSGFLGAIRSVLVDRLRAFLMLLGIGVFVAIGFVASMSLSAIGKFAGVRLPMPEASWALLTTAAAVTLNWLLFMVVYKFLPKAPVRWTEAARGALFASIMWEIGRRVLAAIVIGSRFSVYGVVGSFVAIMLWTFYATTILFLGAEYIQVFCARCNPESVSDVGRTDIA